MIMRNDVTEENESVTMGVRENREQQKLVIKGSLETELSPSHAVSFWTALELSFPVSVPQSLSHSVPQSQSQSPSQL